MNTLQASVTVQGNLSLCASFDDQGIIIHFLDWLFNITSPVWYLHSTTVSQSFFTLYSKSLFSMLF